MVSAFGCVLGQYLPPSLASLKNYVNFIQGVENFSKCDSRRILQSAATISISSSRRIFLARMVNGHLVNA